MPEKQGNEQNWKPEKQGNEHNWMPEKQENEHNYNLHAWNSGIGVLETPPFPSPKP